MHRTSSQCVNSIPRSWAATSKLLERVLASWPDLEAHYNENPPTSSRQRSTSNDAVPPSRGTSAAGATTTTFPLANERAAIEEAYSVIKPVATLIERTERSTVPTAASTLVDLATLRLTVAEPTKPLLVQTPSIARVRRESGDVRAPTRGQSGAEGELAGVAGQEVLVAYPSNTSYEFTKVSRPARDLNPGTTSTRERLREALDKHFFDKRYKERYSTVCY